MYHPTTRVLTVLELLQARGRMAGPELARRLEVDGRTVRRYITMLQDLGVPVEAVRGRGGGYRLRPGYKLPPLMLTDHEAIAVALGLHAARHLGLSVTEPAVEGALAKLERVLPAPVRERVEAVRGTIVMDLPGATPAETAPQTAVVAALAEAVHSAHRVHITYGNLDGVVTERDLDPYGLGYISGRWYTTGFCHLRQDLRVFRIDRIRELTSLAESFVPPPSFDAPGHIYRILALNPGCWTVEARLLLDPTEAAQRVSPVFAVLEPDPDDPSGATRLHCEADDLDLVAHELMGLRCAIEIIQPSELRDAFARLAAKALAVAGASCDNGRGEEARRREGEK